MTDQSNAQPTKVVSNQTRWMTLRTHRYEILAAGLLCASGAVLSLLCFDALMPVIVERNSENVWFDADPESVIEQMSNPWSTRHIRVRRHPLFSLMTTPATYGLIHVVGLSKRTTLQFFLGLAGALNAALFFGLVRKITGAIAMAVVFTVLFLSSSCFVYWCGIPETYMLGAATIMTPLCVVAYRKHLRYLEAAITLAGALALSVTVTNWMSGIAAAFACLRYTRAVQACANALCIVVAGMTLQAIAIPHTASYVFFSRAFNQEVRWVDNAESGGIAAKARILMLASVVAPRAISKDIDHFGVVSQCLSMQTAPVGWRWIAGASLWTSLLLLGGYGIMQAIARRSATALALTVVLAGQIVLHLIYGWETFLYAAHLGPLLILAAAYSTGPGESSRRRTVALSIAVVLVAFQIWNSGSEFMQAAQFMQSGAGGKLLGQ